MDKRIKYDIQIVQREDGKFNAVITIDDVTPVPRADRSLFWMANLHKTLPILANCSGVKVQPRCVIKVYCRLNKKQQLEALRNDATKKLIRDGKLKLVEV